MLFWIPILCLFAALSIPCPSWSAWHSLGQLGPEPMSGLWATNSGLWVLGWSHSLASVGCLPFCHLGPKSWVRSVSTPDPSW